MISILKKNSLDKSLSPQKRAEAKAALLNYMDDSGELNTRTNSIIKNFVNNLPEGDLARMQSDDDYANTKLSELKENIAIEFPELADIIYQ